MSKQHESTENAKSENTKVNSTADGKLGIMSVFTQRCIDSNGLNFKWNRDGLSVMLWEQSIREVCWEGGIQKGIKSLFFRMIE
jgi:hypothetical protein